MLSDGELLYSRSIMTLKYENKKSNMVMLSSGLTRINLFGNSHSGGWSAEMDENGVFTEINYDLDGDENGKVRFIFSDPVYALTDEYELTFKR